MSLGLTSSADFEAELSALSQPIQRSSLVVKEKQARGPNIPEEIKKLAAEEHINGATQKEVAEALHITAPTVSASAHGFVGTNDNKRRDAVLTKHVNSVKERISRKATKKLIGALDSITEEKLSELSAPKAAEVARSMSSIIKDMEPEPESIGYDNRVQIVVFAPREKSLDDFEVVKALE